MPLVPNLLNLTPESLKVLSKGFRDTLMRLVYRKSDEKVVPPELKGEALDVFAGNSAPD